MGIFSRSKSVPTAEVAVTGDGAAVSLGKVLQQAPALVDKYKHAAISLEKRGLTGIRAQVVMLLDHSGSMYRDYENGKVQQLVDRALAFGLNVDVDGEIQIIPFDSRVRKAVTASMGNYDDIVNRKVYKRNDMGSTNLAAALQAVKAEAKHATTPIYCIVITDGQPDDRMLATKAVCELSFYPVFIKFLAIEPMQYLQELDDLAVGPEHPVDNVDAKFLPDVARMTDKEFSEAMADEWDTWVRVMG